MKQKEKTDKYNLQNDCFIKNKEVDAWFIVYC